LSSGCPRKVHPELDSTGAHESPPPPENPKDDPKEIITTGMIIKEP
jgi:hypothetical protein